MSLFLTKRPIGVPNVSPFSVPGEEALGKQGKAACKKSMQHLGVLNCSIISCVCLDKPRCQHTRENRNCILLIAAGADASSASLTRPASVKLNLDSRHGIRFKSINKSTELQASSAPVIW